MKPRLTIIGIALAIGALTIYGTSVVRATSAQRDALSGAFRARTPLSALQFRLRCEDAGADRNKDIAVIQAVHDFARAHNGQPIYLDAEIEASDGAGSCDRAETALRGDALAAGDDPISIVYCPPGRSHDACTDNMVRIDATGPPLAYVHSIVLPHEQNIPENLPYRMGEYGHWLNYQGPFIVRFHEGTGFAYATFHVPSPMLTYVWTRAACNVLPENCQ